jgi:hypothetical protein
VSLKCTACSAHLYTNRFVFYVLLLNPSIDCVWINYCYLCDLQHAVTAANRILRFIQREQANLFIVNAPSWWETRARFKMFIVI